QNIIQITAIRPGQIGPDLSASAEQCMALLAGVSEDFLAVRGIAGRAGIDHATITCDFAVFVFGSFSGNAELFGDELFERRIFEVPELAENVGREILGWNPRVGENRHESFRETGA